MSSSDILPRSRVVVLLAACNGERWLDEQVQSILRQQDVDVHLHISVDKGSDNTQRSCETYAAEYSNVTLLPSGFTSLFPRAPHS